MEPWHGSEVLVPSSGVAEVALADDARPSLLPISDELAESTAVDERRWLVRWRQRLIGMAVAVWGAICLLVALAVLATIPALNLLSLGYLLEASGRVARTRRLSAGLIGLRPAAMIGAIVFAGWLLRWPVVLVADLWYASSLIDPASRITRLWGLGWFVLVALLGAMAIAAAATLVIWHPQRLAQLRDALWTLAIERLPRYFWLGLRGFIGSMLWLALPVSILTCGALVRPEAGALISLLGGLLLAPVVMLLPFLQTHFAAENRFAALFEVRAVRRLFMRAPIAFWLALLTTLLFALPLYLLMIEALPREVTWLPSMLFVLFLFPARLVCGWAYARAAKREQPRLWLFRWLARTGMLPLALTYAFVVWLSQYLLWHGVFSLYHQHAFLVPVPFFGG